MEGFDDLFGETYLHFWGEALSGERSDREAGVIRSLLDLEQGTEVLDLACGHGRIANRLAAGGARVTGLDRSAVFLERARAEAAELGVEVEYVEGDMRAIPWRGRFDAVLCWFTAFGYFDDDVLHEVLGGVRSALRPGGCFLLERRRYDPLRGGMDTEYVALRDGRVERYPVFIRSPTYTELRDWLLAAGFSRVEGFGEDGEPLAAEHRRTLWLAHA